MKGAKLFVEKHCQNCNKIFYPTGMWVYKIAPRLKAIQWYCSYNCYLKGKSKYEQQMNKNGRKSFRWRNGDK